MVGGAHPTSLLTPANSAGRMSVAAHPTRSVERGFTRFLSIARRVENLTAGLGGERAPGLVADAVLEEVDRAVDEDDVHAAGVERAGADQGMLHGRAGAVAREE